MWKAFLILVHFCLKPTMLQSLCILQYICDLPYLVWAHLFKRIRVQDGVKLPPPGKLTILYGFRMFSFVFIWFSFVFISFAYDFICFYIIIYDFIWFLNDYYYDKNNNDYFYHYFGGGASFIKCHVFWIFTFFQISNVWLDY